MASSSQVRERLYALGPGLIAATSFGVTDTLAKLVFAAGADVLTVAFIRGAVGIGVMLVYLRLDPPRAPHTPRERTVALVLGVLFAAIVYGLFEAIDLTTVPIAVLTYFIYPLLTGIGGAIFGLEPLGWQGAFAAIVAFIGLALTLGAHPQPLSVAGVALAFGAALCRATFLLVTRAELQDADPRLTTWYSLVSSTVILGIAEAVTMNWRTPQTVYVWFLIIVLSIGVATAILTLYMSTVRIGPFRSALIMNLEPLLATLLSASLLGEVITSVQAVGGAVMLTALVAFQLRR
jgi:probable blue pigment (indigoidine) exporter